MGLRIELSRKTSLIILGVALALIVAIGGYRLYRSSNPPPTTFEQGQEAGERARKGMEEFYKAHPPGGGVQARSALPQILAAQAKPSAASAPAPTLAAPQKK